MGKAEEVNAHCGRLQSRLIAWGKVSCVHTGNCIQWFGVFFLEIFIYALVYCAFLLKVRTHYGNGKKLWMHSLWEFYVLEYLIRAGRIITGVVNVSGVTLNRSVVLEYQFLKTVWKPFYSVIQTYNCQQISKHHFLYIFHTGRWILGTLSRYNHGPNSLTLMF